MLALSLSVLSSYLLHDFGRVRPIEVAAHTRGLFRYDIAALLHFLDLSGSIAARSVLLFSFIPVLLTVEKARTQLRLRPVAAGILK